MFQDNLLLLAWRTESDESCMGWPGNEATVLVYHYLSLFLEENSQ